jgi:signal transduction histidine kinase
MSLGLTAESLSHEIYNIADQLAYRTEQINQHLINSKDSKLISYIEYVNTSINGLRTQLTHLAPSLRYIREKRETIVLVDQFNEILDYYRTRLEKKDIRVRVRLAGAGAFAILMNKGKFVQIVDNLFLNSEYWLQGELKFKQIEQGIITVVIEKPFVKISDNGKGIDPSVETSLFEPFITTKGRGKGRGLGLFIVQQLLEAEGCKISLSPKRNKQNRLYTFEINFTGALDGR